MNPKQPTWHLRRRAVSKFASVVILTVLLIALSPAARTAKAPAPADDVDVYVVGFRDDDGRAIIRLAEMGSGFPDDAARTRDQVVPITRGQVHVRFPAVPDGSYAVAAVHDRNCDQRLTRAAYGLPTEGFGFSDRTGGAQLQHVPSFEQAARTVGPGQRTIHLRIVYPCAPVARTVGCPADGDAAGATDHAGELQLSVSGIAAARGGDLRIRLYHSGEELPGEGHSARYAHSVAVRDPVYRADFVDLPSGRYAAVVLHDVNRNGRRDKNEPLIISGPAPRYGRMPRFVDASFAVQPSVVTRLDLSFPQK